MINDFPFQTGSDEMERNAYNAVFYELGFRWHWDGETYRQLMLRSPHPCERIRFYLETEQPHLLKAYDTEFLVDVIQEKKSLVGKRRASPGHFDWAQSLGGELGA